MISTVSTAAISTMMSFNQPSMGLMVSVALLLFMVQKEILAAAQDERAQTLSRILNVAIVPLLLCFLFITAVNVAEVMR